MGPMGQNRQNPSTRLNTKTGGNCMFIPKKDGTIGFDPQPYKEVNKMTDDHVHIRKGQNWAPTSNWIIGI